MDNGVVSKWFWVWVAVVVLALGFLAMPGGTPRWMLSVPNERDALFVGEWKTPVSTKIFTTTFLADGTGRSTTPFDWGTRDGKLYLRVMSAGSGWYSREARYTFSADSTAVSFGDEWISLPLDLQRAPPGPLVTVGEIVEDDPTKIQKKLADWGIPTSGRLIQLPAPWAVIGRDACLRINEDTPRAIKIFVDLDEPNTFGNDVFFRSKD